jgi:hypothetical protein
VANRLERVSEDRHQARFYCLGMLMAESHFTSRARAMQWADKGRQQMERSSVVLTV